MKCRDAESAALDDRRSSALAIGDLYGHQLYHASLDPEEYRDLLRQHGFTQIIISTSYLAADIENYKSWLKDYQH